MNLRSLLRSVLCLAGFWATALPGGAQASKGFWVLAEVKAEPITMSSGSGIRYDCRMDRKGASFSALGTMNDMIYQGPFEAVFTYGWDLPDSVPAGTEILVTAWVNRNTLTLKERAGASLFVTAEAEHTMPVCVVGPKTFPEWQTRARFEGVGRIGFPSSGGEPFHVYLQANLNAMGQVTVQGKLTYRYEWRAKLDPKAKPSGPQADPPECAWPPDQKQNEILRRYYQEIPKGRCFNGMINNIKSILDPSLEGFRCGGYQGRVLDFLDRLRNSKSPAERCLLKDFDYGPIEIGVGLHQAVVLYRKGTDWKGAGTVLDPWFNQTPEAYSIATWQFKSCVSLGSAGGCTVNGASWLGGWTYYPTVGGPYPGDAAPPRPRPAPKAGRIAVNCPLAPCLVDQGGRVSGYRQGQILSQIPGVTFMSVTLEDGTPWTEFEFTPQRGLRLRLEGLDDGKAVVIASLGMDQPGAQAWQYRLEVKKGEAYTVPMSSPRAPLASPRSAVPAAAFALPDADGLASRLRFLPAAIAPKPTSLATRTYRHVEGAYHVTVATEWTVREQTPQPAFDMCFRTPDRDGCAIYFGRDHDAVSKRGMKGDLQERIARLVKGRADHREEWLRIGPAQGVLVGVFEPKASLMLWHYCLGFQDRIYYIDIESLPDTGRRDLPPRIRELVQSIVFEAQ